MTTTNAQETLLTSRRVLVTGGARGLSYAFARALLAANAKVVISDGLHERGAALAKELGNDVLYVPMDLADAGAIQAGVDAAAAHLGRLDGLINNAAITNSGGKDMGELTVDIRDRVMSVNVLGIWLATVAAQPHLAASGTGRVVNLASDTALWGAPNLLAYVASKGAVIAMTRSMAREPGPWASQSMQWRPACCWWKLPNTCRKRATTITAKAAPSNARSCLKTSRLQRSFCCAAQVAISPVKCCPSTAALSCIIRK